MSSSLYLDDCTALHWGLTPDEWDACSAIAKARMRAHDEAERMMRFVDDIDAQDEAKR